VIVVSWIADLHIHSRYSLATSKECDPRNLYRWAGLKGLSLIGAGDFTHPGWRKQLKEELTHAEPGFYRLRETPGPEIPGQPETRFVVSGELSTIYKKNGRVRKVHHLIVLPSLEAADRISARLEEMGMNIRSDGRPILGLDSYRLLELVLETCPEALFIPAHIWTPHFSVFGSNSGFDSIEECYEDLTAYIYALETGLSSDPGMNWRWSALDRFTLVSNSDAHNPRNLAREANIFNGEFSYPGVRNALMAGASSRNGQEDQPFGGTIEFFPEEGKYHYDGHRNCGIILPPAETKTRGGLCPVCGRKVTVGVLHRVMDLADRPDGNRPQGATPYQSMVPLREIIGSALGQGPGTKKVDEAYFDLLRRFGPELTILRETGVDLIAKAAGPLIAEGIRRLRSGEVMMKPGYDGEYGVISVFNESDRQAFKGQAALFEQETAGPRKTLQLRRVIGEMADRAGGFLQTGETQNIVKQPFRKAGLSPEQEAIITADYRQAIILAGPGSGKTRTLTERIAYLIRNRGVDPSSITGVTFTHKAAEELKSRLAGILTGEKRLNRLNLGTFHGICWNVLNQNPEPFPLKLVDPAEAKELMEEVLRQNRIPMTAREALLLVSLMKNKYLWENERDLPAQVHEIYQVYQNILQTYGRLDFDDVIIQAVQLWEEDPAWLAPFKERSQYLFVDEFQDINPIQYRLIKLWAAGNGNLTVIGDPNQAIYGFRGASAHFFESLRQDFPETVLFQLDQNYRSVPVIIEAANCLISPVHHQQIPTGDTGREPLIWFEAPGEKGSAKAIVTEIISLLGGSTMISAHQRRTVGGKKRKNGDEAYGFNDFAILYRTNRQAEALEEALTIEGLPYRVVGQTATLDNGAVKEFLGFFRYLTNEDDFLALRTALSYPRWGFSGTEIKTIGGYLRGLPGELKGWDFLEKSQEHPEIITKLRQFYGVVEYYRGQLANACTELIQDWMLRMDLAENEEMERIRRIGENYRNVEELLRFLPLAREADIIRKGNKTTTLETITLSTLHAAKGLEFPVVFLTGVEEGLLPYGTDPDQETIDEEQRLFYVGVTRAKSRLYFTNVQYRFRYGQNEPMEVSRFMKLIPAGLMEKIEWTQQNSKQKQLELF
jgi:uncharacterized protein (TIGR00375 family)